MFGSHIGIESTLNKTISGAKGQGMSAVQLFLGGPYTLKRRNVTTEDISACDPSVNLFTHLPYVYNLAGSAKRNTLAWHGDEETDTYTGECLESIAHELNILSQLRCKCKGCVLHIGSTGKNKDAEAGLRAVAQSINKINFTGDAPLLLETMVCNGGVLGKTFDDLKLVTSLVDQDKPIGICIDTCHVFAAGLYDLRTEIGVDTMFSDFLREFKWEDCKLIHLNDSKGSFGDSKDRHQCIGLGEIWKDNPRSLLHLLRIAKHNDIPVVLETVVDDWKVLEELVKKI